MSPVPAVYAVIERAGMQVGHKDRLALVLDDAGDRCDTGENEAAPDGRDQGIELGWYVWVSRIPFCSNRRETCHRKTRAEPGKRVNEIDEDRMEVH